MKYQFYAIIYDVAGNITPVGSSVSPAISFVTNIQKVNGISISPSGSVTKNIGENFTISATITPSDANTKIINWNSTNTSVATVDSNGKVTCISAGSTTITATAADGSGVSASLELTVRNPVNSISLSQSSITIAKDGFTANITLTIDPSDYADSNISWTIANTSIATLSGTGKTRTITSTSTTGDTTLIVSAGGKTATCAIHVVAFTSQTFSYIGKVQSVDLPAGKYKLECWGAQGGTYSTSKSGGTGGYSVGIITLLNNTTLYVYVGQQGITATSETSGVNGGWNGGGAGGGNDGSNQGASGGGATDIALYGTNGSNDWNNSNHLYSRIIVAGGGGGYGDAYGGAGGGSSGLTGGREAVLTSYSGGFGYGGGTTTITRTHRIRKWRRRRWLVWWYWF